MPGGMPGRFLGAGGAPGGRSRASSGGIYIAVCGGPTIEEVDWFNLTLFLLHIYLVEHT